jgi:Polysaccharide deacetylase
MVLGSITIDMDSLNCYRKIHGLEVENEFDNTIMENTISVIIEFFKNLNMKITFFLVGNSIEGNENLINLILENGHEIGNHTWNHKYDFTYLNEDEITDELLKFQNCFKDKFNYKVEGFRTPGYHLSDNLLKVLNNLGFSYSSSSMGSWTYYFIKLLKVSKINLSQKKSFSKIHPLNDLLLPNFPYYPKFENSLKPQNVLEIPITRGKLPFNLPSIGPFIFLSPISNIFIPSQKTPLIINLHGIDFLPDYKLLEPPLQKTEFYLKMDLKKRLNKIKTLIKTAQNKGYHFTKLKNIHKSYK